MHKLLATVAATLGLAVVVAATSTAGPALVAGIAPTGVDQAKEGPQRQSGLACRS